MRNRRSPVEWSASGNVVESGSSNTVAASRKSTSCLLRFSFAFAGSHVNVTETVYPLGCIVRWQTPRKLLPLVVRMNGTGPVAEFVQQQRDNFLADVRLVESVDE